MNDMKITDKFDAYVCCPLCQHENTYHHGCDVYIRDGEDDGGFVAKVRDGDRRIEEHNLTDKEMDDQSPGYRRDSIRIPIECEACGKRSALCVSQIKGYTFLSWEIPND